MAYDETIYNVSQHLGRALYEYTIKHAGRYPKYVSMNNNAATRLCFEHFTLHQQDGQGKPLIFAGMKILKTVDLSEGEFIFSEETQGLF